MPVTDNWLDASKMQVKIGGSIVTVVAQTMRISQAIGQRSTCQFIVLDPTGVLGFQQGQPVEVMSSTDPATQVRLFAGVVMTSKRTNPGWSSTMLHQIACTDWHYLADKRIAATTYANQTVGYIVNDLLINYLAAENVLGIRTQPALTRASVAYYLNGSTDPFASSASSGVARYEASTAIVGSKAIRIEEGTTNLLSANQSDVETNTVGFQNGASAILTAGSTMTRDTAHKWANTAALKLVTTAVAGEGAETTGIAASANTKYTATVWLDGTAGKQWDIVLRDFTNSVQALVTVTLGTDWTKATVTLTTGGSAVTDLRLGVRNHNAEVVTVWADGWQIEQKAYPTTWTPGGTPRAAETLALPALGSVSPLMGTIEFRAFIDATVRRQGAFTNLMGINTSGATTAIGLFHESASANWTLGFGGTTFQSFADSNTPDGWHRFVIAWDASSAYVMVDLTVVATINNPPLPTTLATSWFLGANGSGGSPVNTLYQDLRVSSRKRQSAEYQLLGAVFTSADGDTSYLLPLNNSLLATIPSVTDGPTVTSFLVNYVQVSKALDDLAQLGGFTWQIDENKLLHMLPAAATPAPFTYDGSMGLDIDAQTTVEETNPLYRNGQWIIGIQDVTSTQTETRKGDGATRVFTMSYPLHSTPTVTVNSVAKTVGIGQVDTGKDFYWNQGKNEIFQDSGGTLLISTDTFQAQYIGEWVSNVYAQSGDAVVTEQMVEGAGTGLVEEAHSDSSISTVAQGFALASALLSRYAQIGRTLEFSTHQYNGLAPQQLMPISLPPQWGMAGVSALIESIDITEDGVWWLFSVKAMIGPVNDTWVQYIQRLAGPTTGVVEGVGSQQTISILVPETGAWNWASTYTATVTSCPVFPVTLSPATLC